MITQQRLGIVMVVVMGMILFAAANTVVAEKQCENETLVEEQNASLPIGSGTDMHPCLMGTHDCAIDAICTTNSDGYICICKEGFTGDGHHCNKICTGRSFGVGTQCFILSDNREDFNGAVDACRSLGGALAEPRDLGRLITTLKYEHYSRPQKVMLGWTDRQTEGEWIGMSGHPFGHSDYWISGEPNSWQGREEDCMEIKFMGLDGVNDFECHEAVKYLCEV